MSAYRETLTINTDNHMLPDNNKKTINIIINVGKNNLLRMNKIDPRKSGDFKMSYDSFVDKK